MSRHQAQAGTLMPVAGYGADAMQECSNGRACSHATENDKSPVVKLETHQPNQRIMTPSTNREELCPAKSLACTAVVVSTRKDRHQKKYHIRTNAC